MPRDPFATFGGAYVLGALGTADRHAFERHLPECADCQAEVCRLAGLPGLLSRVSLEDIVADNTPETSDPHNP